jgi:hypothetical protein
MVFGETDITSQGWEGKECTERKISKKPALTTPRWLLPFTQGNTDTFGISIEVLPEASGYLESFPGAEEQEQTHVCVEWGGGCKVFHLHLFISTFSEGANTG